MRTQGLDPTTGRSVRLLEEDELALAIAFSADEVLIVLQEVDHAGVGHSSLLGDIDLRDALRGGLQDFSDFGANDIATHTGPSLSANRG